MALTQARGDAAVPHGRRAHEPHRVGLLAFNITLEPLTAISLQAMVGMRLEHTVAAVVKMPAVTGCDFTEDATHSITHDTVHLSIREALRGQLASLWSRVISSRFCA